MTYRQANDNGADSERMSGNQTRFHYQEGVRAVSGTDGMSVMNRSTGKYFALTRTCCDIWSFIGEGKSIGEMKDILQRKYPETGERSGTDLVRFLDQLMALSLIAPAGDIAPREPITDSSSYQNTNDSESIFESESCRFIAFFQNNRYIRDGRISKTVWIALAYSSLILTDCLLKGLGFARFYRTVRRWPCERMSMSGERQKTQITAIVSIVNSAAAYYFKRAWCLQRSAVTTCLLRLRGIPAELVIGVREMPFLSHAWVEVAGEVVNDRSIMQRYYKEIERC
jgi:hypothetical protein